jgi:hypothetical protein
VFTIHITEKEFDMRILRHSRPRLLGVAITAAMLLPGVAACSSDGGTASGATTTVAAGASPTAGGGATESDAMAPTTVADASGKVDPCKDLTAMTVSGIVGFAVEGDGRSHDNGAGFVSCQFKAPMGSERSSGAIVTIGVDDVQTLDEIEQTLGEMTSDVDPTEIEVGDGGWLLSTKGMAELRANAGDVQVQVNITMPMDDQADLGIATTNLATAVVDGL